VVTASVWAADRPERSASLFTPATIEGRCRTVAQQR